jgi:hypothetical protein
LHDKFLTTLANADNNFLIENSTDAQDVILAPAGYDDGFSFADNVCAATLDFQYRHFPSVTSRHHAV